MESLEEILKELRQEKRNKRIKPEVLSLASIKNRYKSDPLPKLRELWALGTVKSCRLLNDLGFFYYGE